MVKIAVAGGAGSVGSEIIDALVARNQHDILILSRKDAPSSPLQPGVRWVRTTYTDIDQLASLLSGVDTVLSFISVSPGDSDKAFTAQKNLIDASIRQKVRRFAPSEWVTSKLDDMPWYAFKKHTRQYLAEINKNEKVLEYTLFQPGLFTNYMTFPYSSAKHVPMMETPIDFHNRRILTVEGHEGIKITLTTAQDLAKIVALAIEYQAPWPVVGGIQGLSISMNDLIKLGERVRGGKFNVEKLPLEDLKTGNPKASWYPHVTHQSIPPEQRTALAAAMLSGILLGISSGSFDVSDEWNQLLPDIKFTQPEEFLSQAWAEIENGATSVFQDY